MRSTTVRGVVVFCVALVLPTALRAQGRCPAPDFAHGDHSADMFVDSTAFLADLTSAWPKDTQLAVATLHFNPKPDDPSTKLVSLHASGMSSEAQDSIRALLEGHLREIQPELLQSLPDERRILSVFLGDADGPRFRSLKALPTCKPVMKNIRFVRQMIAREAKRLTFQRQVSVLIWAFVDEDGDVTETRIAESSGRMPIDRAMQRLARRLKFEPAEVAGIPVSLWVQYPITLVKQ